ncbi:transcriptional regulator [Chitinophaga sp. MD30]|nr:transcriptional regulator [Chitinophaga sp. MD30]
MRKLLYLLICSFFYSTFAIAQNTIGLPAIVNYSKKEFRGGAQTWDTQQDKNGILYFANNEGLISFDGGYWKVYTLPNKTIVRSLRIDTDGKIYVGGQDEFGYFFPDQSGILRYHSLKHLIPSQFREFADVWNVVILRDEVYFQSNDRIFQYKGNNIRVFKPIREWNFLASAGGRLFAQDRSHGLLQFNDGIWQPISNFFSNGNQITAILPYGNDTVLITTMKTGMYLLHDGKITRKQTEADALLAADRIYKAVNINEQLLAIGTTSGGCIVMDHNGKIIQRFTMLDGLQKNNILSIFADAAQNLWIGMENGIDFVAYNSAVKYILPDKHNPNSSYTIRIHDQHLYIGTSNGLYSVPLNMTQEDLSYSKGDFSLVANTEGQVWNLTELNKQLLLGHEYGTYVVNPRSAQSISSAVGTWRFLPLSTFYPATEIITGTYTGLYTLQYKDNRFIEGSRINGLIESLRFIALDNNNVIWTSHPYRGVFKLVLAPDHTSLKATLYTDKNGLPSTLGNFVYHIKNRVMVATEKGLYEFDESRNKFVASSLLSDVTGPPYFRYLQEDPSGNIWFVQNKTVGVADYSRPQGNKPYSLLYFPELTAKVVTGFEHIYPFNAENIFIGSERGAIHLNYQKYQQSAQRLRVILSEVHTVGPKDSVIFGGYFTQGRTTPRLDNHQNSFRFAFSSNLFEQLDNITYSYRLIGFDSDWSEWSSKREKDYTNLPMGRYTFLVKARNNLGVASSPVAYTFIVAPAWYQTWWAIAAYLALAGGLAWWIVRWQRERFRRQQQQFEEEQKRLTYLHQLELDRNEKAMVSLQNEKLATEVDFKNKELATVTMHLVQRGKLLSAIKEELIKWHKQKPGTGTNNPATATDLRKVLHLLNDAEKNDNDWDQFAIHFDQVHSNFLSVLKARFPQLSATDLKLCAYLRMNLSSKEIAQLLNISVRGVEVSRYRLRKKLQLPTEVNLFDYLMQIV